MKAWHFAGATLRDGTAIPADGVTLRHTGDLKLCASGLHASQRIINALRYAPGNTICRVECSGEIITGDDKLVCSERTILWRVDGDELLRAFSRHCALGVIDLWNAPDVVRQYLETGDESLRAAASAAAKAAVDAALWAEAAAADAALDATAWAAAADAAARDVSRDAANAAANAAARATAWDAARDAAESKQNDILEAMVREARR